MKKVLIIVCIVMIIAAVAGLGSTLFVSKGASSVSEDVSASVVSPSQPSGGSGSSTSTDPQGFEFVSTVDLSDKTYIAYGDSITWGWSHYNRVESPYPALVEELLGLSSSLNVGINGATFCSNDLGRANMTQTILSRTDTADIVSVMLGVNDYAASLPLGSANDIDNTTIYGSLYLIMEHFSSYYPDSFVFFMTPYQVYLSGHDGYTDNSQGYDLADVSNAIKTMASRYGFTVLDLLSEGRFEDEIYFSGSDGIHPSQEFFRNYTAPQIAQFINDHFDSDRS